MSRQGYTVEGVRLDNYNKWSARRKRNLDFKKGDEILFCRCPRLTKGETPRSAVDVVPQPLIEYEGDVVQVTDYHITVNIKPREGQIGGFGGEIKPYKVSLSKSEIGVTDLIVKKEAEYD